MQQQYVIRGSRCFADGNERPATVAVNEGKCGTVLDFDETWPCLLIDIGTKVPTPQRSLGEKLSATMKRYLAIQLASLIYDTGDK